MKTISKIILSLSVVFAALSCGETGGPDVTGQIVGEWHLVSVSGLSDSDVPEVYVDFSQDFTFELYQQVGEGRYRRYDGTWRVSGNILSGIYSDGEEWGSSYGAFFDGDNLVLTAGNGSGEVCTYEKKALSESDKADAYPVTRSFEDGSLRFL